MADYRLSVRADEDYESIYIYGLLNFGLVQADIYASGMQSRFEQLANQPLLYPAVDHVRPGFRMCGYGSHAIYYRVEDGNVLIVRILRNQEVAAALPDQCSF